MLKRLLTAGFLSILAIGIAAPFIQADSYGQQIRDALQRGLNRKVNIGAVHFNLFTGPGFTIENVVIFDHPSMGLEPFAHMRGLEARVRLSSLLTGRLDFSMLRFVSPSVNLAKPETGSWNVVRMFQDAQPGQFVPEIQVTDGRFFLKTGNNKSAFYIANADVTVSPASDALYLRFSGEPARSDRASHMSALFTANGYLKGGNLNLDLELEKSPVNELGGLIRGNRLQYHGSIASRAKLSGPLSKLNVSGSFNLSDVHRWDLMTEHNRSWTVDYKGLVDAASERIDLATVNSPNRLSILVSDWIKDPQWSVDLAVNELSASTLVGIARDLGAPMPPGITVDGRVAGAVGFHSRTGLQGQLNVTEGSVRLQDGPHLKLAEASLRMTGNLFELDRTALVGEEDQGAQLEGKYDTATRILNATVSGHGLRLLSRAAVPLVSRFEGGRWSAALRYRQDDAQPGVWTGSFDVRDTTTRVPGVAEPLRLVTARLEIDGEVLNVRQMRASAGSIEIYGSYSYNPALQRPHRFDLTTPKAGLADIEALFAPALRRDEGFFARTLRLRRASVPDWLAHRKAEGRIRIGSLEAGGILMRAVRARVVWEGNAVQLGSLEGRFERGSFSGTGTVNLSKSEPQYTLQGNIDDLAWKGGTVDLEGSLRTLGSGIDLLRNLHSDGKFLARGLVISPEQTVRSADGAFDLSVTRTGPRYKLSDVRVSLGAERYTGDGTTLADGRLRMELASANRDVHFNLDIEH